MPHPLSASMAVARAPITQIYGADALERMRCVRVTAGQEPKITWTMMTPAGEPVNLTDTVGGTVVFRHGDAAHAVVRYVSDGVIDDAANGVVSAVVERPTLAPGVYHGEFGLINATGGLVFANPLYLISEPSAFWPGDWAQFGIPTVAEIRMHLRDSSPAEHRLIDTVEFDDAEVAAAIVQVVRYWNETPPPLPTRYSTGDFPYRQLLLEGTAASLYRMAAAYFRANHLAYQASGVAVDDLAKAPEFEQAAAGRWQAFEQQVRTLKVQLNMNNAWGIIPSPYSQVWTY